MVKRYSRSVPSFGGALQARQQLTMLHLLRRRMQVHSSKKHSLFQLSLSHPRSLMRDPTVKRTYALSAAVLLFLDLGARRTSARPPTSLAPRPSPLGPLRRTVAPAACTLRTRVSMTVMSPSCYECKLVFCCVLTLGKWARVHAVAESALTSKMN